MNDKTRIHPKIAELEAELRADRLDRRSFLRLATLLGLSSAAAYGLAGVPMAQAETEGTPRKGGRLRIALRTNDISDPHTYSWGQPMYMRQVLETLTQTGVDNVTRPLLLEGWEASDDLMTWTLRLREDVTWSDGRQFVADDVVWNLERVLDPAVGSASVGLFAGFMMETYETGETDDDGNARTSRRLWREDAIEKVDDFTVVLHGHSPNVVIPELLYHYQITMLDPADDGVFTLESAHTGPYRIAEFQQGQRILMQARDDYWGEGPYIEELEIIDLGDDPNAHLAALASDQIDGWPWTDNVTLPALRMLDHVEIYEAHTANTGAVRMRVDEPPFDDPRVRKAMRLAVDNDAVLQLGLGGQGYVGEHHLVSPQHPDYGDVEPLGHDVEEARRLLEEAGYPDGITGEIYLKSSPAWEGQVVQSLIEQWREAGINIDMRPVPAAQYWEIWRQVPLGFTDWHHRPLGIMLYGLVFRTGGNWNESGYSNAEFDEILASAEGAVDVDARRDYMAQLQTILMEDGPLVQPVYRSIYSAWNRKLRNFELHPTNHNYFKYYWIDET